MSSNDDSKHDVFLRWFTTSEPALRGFVRSLVPTASDADDVLQEIAVTLWKKYTEFNGETEEDFRRWAFGVAKFKVLSWKRDKSRERLLFSDDMTNLLAEESGSRVEKLSAQREALKVCLEKLPAKQKSLIEAAYAPGVKVEQVAKTAGRTAMALYKQLHRIRLVLIECTRNELTKSGW